MLVLFINVYQRFGLTFSDSSMHSSFLGKLRLARVRETPSGIYTSGQWYFGTDASG